MVRRWMVILIIGCVGVVQAGESIPSETQRCRYAAEMAQAQLGWEAKEPYRVQLALENTSSYPDRGFEWYFWHNRFNSDAMPLKGHTRWVTSAAFSPDGTRLVTGSGDATAKIWDVKTKRVLLSLSGVDETRKYLNQTAAKYDGVFANAEPHGVWCVAWSPDGQWVLTSGDEFYARLWDANSGQMVRTFPELESRDWLEATAFRMPKKLRHGNRVVLAVFSPDSKRVLSGDNDGLVILWDLESGKDLYSFKSGGFTEARSRAVHGAAFSPDGRTIAVGDYGAQLKLHDARDGRVLLVFSTQDKFGLYESLAFTPDGSKLITVGDRCDTTVWDVKTGQALRTFKGLENVKSVGVSPDGQLVVIGGVDGKVRIMNLETGEEVACRKGHSRAINAVAFSPNGRQFVSGCMEGQAKLWNLSPSPDRIELSADRPGQLAFSPDGEKLAVGGLEGGIQIWEIRSGKQVATLKGHTSMITGLGYLLGGCLLVSGSSDSSIKIWDPIRTNVLRSMVANQSHVASLVLSPDGNRIVAAGINGLVKVWNAGNGQELLVTTNQVYIKHMAISLDGQWGGISDHSGSLKVWGLADGKERLTITPGRQERIDKFAFSPDGNTLVAGHSDFALRVWELATGRSIRVLRGHSNPPTSVAFSPDGRRILSGDSDAVRIWDAESGLELLSLPVKWVSHAVFSPDGSMVAVAGGGSVTLWLGGHSSESDLEK